MIFQTTIGYASTASIISRVYIITKTIFGLYLHKIAHIIFTYYAVLLYLYKCYTI